MPTMDFPEIAAVGVSEHFCIATGRSLSPSSITSAANRAGQSGADPKCNTRPHTAVRFNQAEIELSLIARQCPGTRRIPNTRFLATSLNAWNAKANHARNAKHWKFARKAARIMFGYQRNPDKRPET